MRIVVTADGETLDAPVDQRFGRAVKFIVYDSDTKERGYISEPGLRFHDLDHESLARRIEYRRNPTLPLGDGNLHPGKAAKAVPRASCCNANTVNACDQ